MSCGIHLRAISQEALMKSACDVYLDYIFKITTRALIQYKDGILHI